MRWLLHQLWAELDVCSSKGQGCAQLGVEFLLLTACILSRLFLPFPSDLLQVFRCFNVEMLNDIFVVSCGR